MKDKLIELIINTPPTRLKAVGRMMGKTYTTASGIANHLLANGVTILPCNVGDSVYAVDDTRGGILDGKITHLEFNTYTTPREWITVVIYYPFLGPVEEKNRIDLVLGKTIFLSREEAEKALAERSRQ